MKRKKESVTIIKGNSIMKNDVKKDSIVISIANFKGGVGKTTSTINIGAALARMGYKVLLIDLDPQFNLTQSFGIKDPNKSIYHTLIKGEELLILPVNNNLFLVPSSLELTKAEWEIASKFKREYILDTAISKVKADYDYVLIDCPPALGSLTVNSFVASNYIIIPIEAEFYALKGYTVLHEAIGGMGLEIDKVFITKYDNRKVLNRDVLTSLKDSLGDKVFHTHIRDNISLAEAPMSAKDIFSYDDTCYGAHDYKALADEIINELK